MPRGQTAHLEGKRTGRPRGTGSRSRLLPDLRWAYETIAEPEARPPNARARFCKEFALRDPASFLTLLGDLEAREKCETLPLDDKGPASGTSPAKTNGAAPGVRIDFQPRRLKRVTISESDLFSHVRAESRVYVHNPPHDAHVVACKVDTLQRQIHLIIRSEDFEALEEGKPIPDLDRKIVQDFR